MSRPAPSPPRIAGSITLAILLCATLPGCATQPAGEDGLWRWEADQLAREEARLERSPHTIDDPELGLWIDELLLRIDPGHAPRIRVFIVDRDDRQADLVGGRLLRLGSGLLRELRDEDELLFVLAHEIAHRRLGHFAARKRSDWDPLAAEIAADAEARLTLQRLGRPDGAGRTLLTRLVTRLERADDIATIRRRIEALPETTTTAAPAAGVAARDDARFARLLARYR